jgi:DNA ligase-1
MPKTVDPKTARREFLQLAQTYHPEKPPRGGYNFANCYVSEKLDGQRAFWDGGVTRGMKTLDVPWASVINPKTGARKTKIKPIATGLWSRYGNPIMAPDWFLNGLPVMPLDGELFAGRGNFQQTMSIVRKDNPIDEEWQGVQFAVYSSPPFEAVFGDGEIKNSNFHCKLNWDFISTWLMARMAVLPFRNDFVRMLSGASFDDELMRLQDVLSTPTDFAYLHRQIKLPAEHKQAVGEIERQLDKTLDVGGEGLIIRSATDIWYPKRMKYVLKYKPHDDAESTITGFTSGRIGKEGKLRGKIGALITEYQGKRLEIAGLTHAEREFATGTQAKFAHYHPGVDMPVDFAGKEFKVGDTITFKYRELSDAGIPKDARYFRGVQ